MSKNFYENVCKFLSVAQAVLLVVGLFSPLVVQSVTLASTIIYLILGGVALSIGIEMVSEKLGFHKNDLMPQLVTLIGAVAILFGVSSSIGAIETAGQEFPSVLGLLSVIVAMLILPWVMAKVAPVKD